MSYRRTYRTNRVSYGKARTIAGVARRAGRTLVTISIPAAPKPRPPRRGRSAPYPMNHNRWRTRRSWR